MYCPKCGTKLESHHRICHNCGEMLGHSEGHAMPKTHQADTERTLPNETPVPFETPDAADPPKTAETHHRLETHQQRQTHAGPQVTVKIPQTITIDTTFINKLSKYQKLYVGGGLLVILSSFLPWVNFSGLGGTGLTLRSNSLNIWNFGLFNTYTLFYIAPLAVLGYIAYQELVMKKVVAPFMKSVTLSLICLFTFSINLIVLIGVSQFQSLLGTMGKISGTQAITGNLFGVGIGTIGGVIGCSLIAFGLLAEIKEQK